MKYCKKCKHTYDDKTEFCLNCRRETVEVDDSNTPVYLISASGFELQRIQTALNDSGIPNDKVPKKRNFSSEAVTGYDISEYDILVPYSALENAYDVCVGIGAIELEEETVIDGEVDQPVNADVKSADEQFEEMTGRKRTVVRAVSAILLILIFSGVILGVDRIMEFIMGLFR